MGKQGKQIKNSLYQRYIKRILDIILSAFAIILLSPLLLIVSILVRVKLGHPIIFKQQRPGLNEKIFTMYKFRTMTDKRDSNGNLLSDSLRLTKFGKLLRSTSIDELPELFNILKGDLCIVGPRPQLVKDMVFMTKKQRQRHSVGPGLTGWAQVNGRNNVTWERKIELDLEYIENVNFIGDLKIIFMTVKKVFHRDDVNTDGFDTAENYGDYLLNIGKIDSKVYSEKLDESEMILQRHNNRGERK